MRICVKLVGGMARCCNTEITRKYRLLYQLLMCITLWIKRCLSVLFNQMRLMNLDVIRGMDVSRNENRSRRADNVIGEMFRLSYQNYY